MSGYDCQNKCVLSFRQKLSTMKQIIWNVIDDCSDGWVFNLLCIIVGNVVL